MKATIVDLRYKMKEVLNALKRREVVHILYHGKEAGIIHPVGTGLSCSENHPLFGFCDQEKESVREKMNRLRGPRY